MNKKERIKKVKNLKQTLHALNKSLNKGCMSKETAEFVESLKLDAMARLSVYGKRG